MRSKVRLRGLPTARGVFKGFRKPLLLMGLGSVSTRSKYTLIEQQLRAVMVYLF